jgi:spore germination cell wall hydrolase CwlJ-like protein
MMFIKNKQISKVLLVVSSILLSINLALPPVKAYAQSVMIEEVGSQFNEEVNCLAQNIYYEAAKETYEGKLAVAQVTINRVNSGKFADTVCGVVKQKDRINGVMVCQFSWFCNTAYTRLIRNQYQWEESVIVATRALTEPVAHDMLYKNKAMYYHANYVNPGWHLTKVTQIGNHIFYR